jgi:hypothetical protein
MWGASKHSKQQIFCQAGGKLSPAHHHFLFLSLMAAGPRRVLLFGRFCFSIFYWLVPVFHGSLSFRFNSLMMLIIRVFFFFLFLVVLGLNSELCACFVLYHLSHSARPGFFNSLLVNVSTWVTTPNFFICQTETESPVCILRDNCIQH